MLRRCWTRRLKEQQLWFHVVLKHGDMSKCSKSVKANQNLINWHELIVFLPRWNRHISASVRRALRFDTLKRRRDKDGKGGFSQREGELGTTVMMTRGMKQGRALLCPPTTMHDSLPVYVDPLLWQRVKLQVGDSSIDRRSKGSFCHSDKKIITQGEVTQLLPEY